MIKIPLLCKRNCIIQILCILAVNGDCPQGTQIKTACQLAGPLLRRGKILQAIRPIQQRFPIPASSRNKNLLRQLFCFLHYLSRKCLRKAIGTHNGQDISSRIIYMTQYFLYAALRIFPAASKICNLHNHLMAIYCPHIAALGNKNIL